MLSTGAGSTKGPTGEAFPSGVDPRVRAVLPGREIAARHPAAGRRGAESSVARMLDAERVPVSLPEARRPSGQRRGPPPARHDGPLGLVWRRRAPQVTGTARGRLIAGSRQCAATLCYGSGGTARCVVGDYRSLCTRIGRAVFVDSAYTPAPARAQRIDDISRLDAASGTGQRSSNVTLTSSKRVPGSGAAAGARRYLPSRPRALPPPWWRRW